MYTDIKFSWSGGLALKVKLGDDEVPVLVRQAPNGVLCLDLEAEGGTHALYGRYEQILGRVLAGLCWPNQPRLVLPSPEIGLDCTRQGRPDTELAHKLCGLLSEHSGPGQDGNGEGAVEVLRRLLGELVALRALRSDQPRPSEILCSEVVEVPRGGSVATRDESGNVTLGASGVEAVERIKTASPTASVQHTGKPDDTIQPGQAGQVDKAVKKSDKAPGLTPEERQQVQAALEAEAKHPQSPFPAGPSEPPEAAPKRGRGKPRRISAETIINAGKPKDPDPTTAATDPHAQPTIAPIAVEEALRGEMADLSGLPVPDETPEPVVALDEPARSDRWELIDELSGLLLDPPLPDTVDVLADRDARKEFVDSAFVRLWFRADVVRLQEEARQKLPGYQAGKWRPLSPTEPLISLTREGAAAMADLLFEIDAHTDGQIDQIHLFCTLQGDRETAQQRIWEKFQDIRRRAEAAKAKLAPQS